MINLELITQNAQTLEDFLEAVQNNALEAEDNMVCLPNGRTIDRWGSGW